MPVRRIASADPAASHSALMLILCMRPEALPFFHPIKSTPVTPTGCPRGTECVSDYCGGCFATCVRGGGSSSSGSSVSDDAAADGASANATCAANRAPCNCTSDCCSSASICVSYTPASSSTGGGTATGGGSGTALVPRRTGSSSGGSVGTAALPREAAVGSGGSGRRLLQAAVTGVVPRGTAPAGSAGSAGGAAGTVASVTAGGGAAGGNGAGRVIGPATPADADADVEATGDVVEEEPTVTTQAPAGVLLTVPGSGNGSGTCVSRRVVGAVQRRLQLSAATGAEGRATGNLTEYAC